MDGAARRLEAALDDLDVGRAPYQRVRLLIELARLHVQQGERASAVLDAKAAASTLAGLDVVLDPRDAALIDGLTEDTPSRPSPTTFTLARDGKWWLVEGGGAQARLRSTKGLGYLAELISNPSVERHALDLVDRVEGVPTRGEVDRRSLGDAGEILDAQARAAYRKRIEQLRAESEEALDAGDLDGAEALQGELDQLVGQLAQAFGLGGRSRRASSAAERARVNVTRALRSAITNVADALPSGGDDLDRSIRTGLYCVYEPAGDDIRWIVQSGVNETPPD